MWWWLSLATIAMVFYIAFGAISISPRSPTTLVATLSFLRGFGRGAMLFLTGFSLLAALATALLFLLHRIRGDRYKSLGTTDPVKSVDPEMYAGRLDRADSNWHASSSASDPPPREEPPAQWSLELLRALEWKRIEQLAALYFRALNFKVVESPCGPDGGVDLRLFLPGELKPGILVQCKAWTSSQVGVKEIRELFGVMAAEAVAEGIFLTTSTFTGEAYNFARGKDITLIDGNDFLRKIGALASDQQADMLATITQGDYTTPTCPSCGVKMVARIVRDSGESFWGCTGFPGCRTTMRAPRAR